MESDRAFLPRGIKEEKEEDKHVFYKLKLYNDKPPEVIYAIVIFQDLRFNTHSGDKSIPLTNVGHLLATQGKIESVDEVKNVIAYMNNLDPLNRLIV